MTTKRSSGPGTPTRTADHRTEPATAATPSFPRLPTAAREVLDAVSDIYVVAVHVDGDHLRRRIYLSLSSAQRAAERAEARGKTADIVLCRVTPVVTR